TGDRETLIASAHATSGARLSRTVLATAGDRLALEHHLWTEADDAVPIEVETFEVIEVDAEGRIVAAILFDPDDRRAASLELLDRRLRNETSAHVPRSGFELRSAVIAHDLQRLRAALPDDFVFHDHRRTGLGRIDTADEYVGWFAALFEL